MSDEVDITQRAESFRADLAIRAARAGADHLARPSDFGLCLDCIQPIPAARRAAVPGAVRCAPCQGRAERDPRSNLKRRP